MQLGIPGFGSNIQVQRIIDGASIASSNLQVPQGAGLSVGLEFWSHNYGPNNAQKTPGASDTQYDWGDALVPDTPNGYGCLQIHVPSHKSTVLAVNRFKQPTQADLGIGNAPGQHSDWTFSGTAKNYTHKRLRVFVRPKP